MEQEEKEKFNELIEPIFDELFKIFKMEYLMSRYIKDQRKKGIKLIAKQVKKVAKEMDNVELTQEKSLEFAKRTRLLFLEMIDENYKETKQK